MITITESMLDGLRRTMAETLSPKRFRHTAMVEEMAAELAALFCPQLTMSLRAAALLHDLTKEYDVAEHRKILTEHGIRLTEQDLLSPKTLHARTAALLIPERFPEFADPTILSAVRWHTTGHARMSLPEKILYLADYIDQSRTFADCVTLRRYFWEAEPAKLDKAGREALLRDTLIFSFDLTIRDLLANGNPIAGDTVNARNELLAERARQQICSERTG